VTRVGTDSFHPFWSPDGQRLIYCSADPLRAGATEVDEIYTIRPDGSDRASVARLGGINTYASFSPDGKQILFRKLLSDGNSEIWVMEHNGHNPKNLTNDPAFDGWPGWSPDGRRIVFASNRKTKGKDYDISVMSSDGSGVRRLTNVPGRNTSPKWSPDGSQISFDNSANGQVRILRIPFH
jgi:TolB protein